MSQRLTEASPSPRLEAHVDLAGPQRLDATTDGTRVWQFYALDVPSAVDE